MIRVWYQFSDIAQGFMAVIFVEESYNIDSMHHSCGDIYCQTNFWRNIFSSYENSLYTFHAYLITQHQDSSIVRFFTLVKWLLSKFTLKSRFRSCTVYFGHGYFQVLMKKIYLCICTFDIIHIRNDTITKMYIVSKSIDRQWVD